MSIANIRWLVCGWLAGWLHGLQMTAMHAPGDGRHFSAQQSTTDSFFSHSTLSFGRLKENGGFM